MDASNESFTDEETRREGGSAANEFCSGLGPSAGGEPEVSGLPATGTSAAPVYPSLEETRDAPLVEGEHLWIAWAPSSRPDKPMICCRWCGVVQRRDGRNNSCRGIVKVTLR